MLKLLGRLFRTRVQGVISLLRYLSRDTTDVLTWKRFVRRPRRFVSAHRRLRPPRPRGAAVRFHRRGGRSGDSRGRGPVPIGVSLAARAPRPRPRPGLCSVTPMTVRGVWVRGRAAPLPPPVLLPVLFATGSSPRLLNFYSFFISLMSVF